ncbi:uncharacterized protein LOC127792777 [Diospyros lotus]|uniref:uncharacterized protein LOC127792777 n=1 Tax=Diospyros lotus TaxID=55363 RepID=UPI00225875C7|nr:uncharacterized protein LOC127792777 [Diospyros lotus]XP_052179315.1 uncharacterized protein LOC127792777 [Diospyros lotus]XP_052179316.1 uncharacterized protein LOC127792777 [Diospyros lotus]
MGRALLRQLSRCFFSLQTFRSYSCNAKVNTLSFGPVSLSAFPCVKPRYFSSKSDAFIKIPHSVPETNSPQNEDSSAEVEDVSKEELKRRIEKYFEGDEEVIPSIFEAILKRKLTGKHDESDNELMEEFGHKPSEGDSHEEFDSD